MTTYSSVVRDFISLMQEAKDDNLDTKEAQTWAHTFVYNLETQDQAKDMAHYLDIGSLEILHPQTLRAQLRKVITDRLANAADDEINQDDEETFEDNYGYDCEEWEEEDDEWEEED